MGTWLALGPHLHKWKTMTNNTTTVHIKVSYKDWIVPEDKLSTFINSARSQIAKSLSIDSESVVIEKIIQENPIWLDPNIGTAEA